MSKTLFFTFLLVLSSCNFNKTIPQKEELLTERLQEIDWSEVTRYPSVPACDSFMDKTDQKNCFFNYLTQWIQQKLLADTLSVLYPKIDTLHIKMTINTDASLVFESQFKENQNDQTQKIDSIVKFRLQDFPQIEPAQKEGIPVKTEFFLPIVIKMDSLKN